MTEKHYTIFTQKFTEKAFEISRSLNSNKALDLLTLCDDYQLLIEDCKSPIEMVLGTSLLFANNGYTDLKYCMDINELTEALSIKDKEINTYVTCQQDIGEYRVDFLLRTYFKGNFKDIIIECDGHNFHGKTKEQVARDKKRDRYLTSMGYFILRFSGSEIYNNPDKCIEEINGILAIQIDIQMFLGASYGK